MISDKVFGTHFIAEMWFEVIALESSKRPSNTLGGGGGGGVSVDGA